MNKVALGIAIGVGVSAVLVYRFIAAPIADGFAEAFGYSTK